MFYGKRRLPLWAKWAAVVFAVLLVVLPFWKGHQAFRSSREPEPVSVPTPAPLPAPEHPLPTETRPGTTPPPETAPASLPPIKEHVEIIQPSLPYEARIDEPWIHIVKGQFRLYFYRGEVLEKVYPVATGANGGQKQRVGDNRTPVGRFSVQQIQDSRKWTYDFGDGKGPVRGAYGPWFIRLRTPGWSGIGIHGTHDPGSIGTMITQGCIRLANRDLEEVKQKVHIGMKVIISE